MNHRGNRRPSSGRRNFNRSRSTKKRTSRGADIHPSKFVRSAIPVSQQEYTAVHTFADFNINALLYKNIAKRGFSVPSPIQDQAIPEGLNGRDVIGVADTGTGKTMAFAIPALHRLLIQKESRMIVLAPTRELAQQILEEIKTLTCGTGMRHTLLIGGASMSMQLKDLTRGPRIVIGTPGRIQDHIQRRKIDLARFNIVVLDEVDRMLDMGFVKDMRTILAKLPAHKQSLFFSATVDARVRILIDEFTKDPVTISVKTGDTGANIDQNIIRYSSSEDKFEKLRSLLMEQRKNKVLIFDATKRGADRLSKKLTARGFAVEVTHGNKSLGQRKRALSRFKSNDARVLVATDVAARGIDVADITHVINYSVPNSYDDYVHRIGRAGRAGRIGYALTFIAS